MNLINEIKSGGARKCIQSKNEINEVAWGSNTIISCPSYQLSSYMTS
jgi:hypothetical protein